MCFSDRHFWHGDYDKAEMAHAELDAKEDRRPRSEPIHPDRSVTACCESHAQQAEANKRRLPAEIELEKVARAAAGDFRLTYILCPEPPSNYQVCKVIPPAGDTPKNRSNREQVLETLEG
jgi:hypothetical protein